MKRTLQTTALILAALISLLAIDFFLWRPAEFKEVESRLKQIETARGEILYMEVGPEDGTPILMPHGGSSGPDQIYGFQWLTPHGFRLISIARDGYVGSPVREGVTLEDQADDYAALLEALGIDSAHVFAASMGGATGIHYADRHPQKTKSLVLWCAVSKTYNIAADLNDSAIMNALYGSSPLMQDLLGWLTERTFLLFPGATLDSYLSLVADISAEERKRVIEHELSDPERKALLKEFFNSLTPMSVRSEGTLIDLALTQTEWEAPLSSNTAPLLAVYSPVDRDVAPEHYEYVRAQRPDGKFLTPRAGGHFVWWGPEGDMVLAETLNFLKAH